MKKLTMVFMVLMFVWVTMAFRCGRNSTPNPNQGFFARVTANGIPTGADLQGSLVGGNPTVGTLSQFPRTSLFGVGFTQIANTRLPGTWRLTTSPGFSGGSLCLGIETVDRNISLSEQITLPCRPLFFSFTASPSAVNALSPPPTIDVTGNGSDSLYGTPMIAFYDEFGNVAASGPANQLLYNNGVVSGVRVNVSDLSQAYDGTYTGLVHNVRADGTWEVIGAAAITVYGNPPPPDDGGGGGGCGPQSPGLLRPACDY